MTEDSTKPSDAAGMTYIKVRAGLVRKWLKINFLWGLAIGAMGATGAMALVLAW